MPPPPPISFLGSDWAVAKKPTPARLGGTTSDFKSPWYEAFVADACAWLSFTDSYVPSIAPAIWTAPAIGARKGKAIDATSNTEPPTVRALETSSPVVAPVPPKNPPLEPIFA
eukprot:COSAG01_NODE_24233_length_786_cov_0.612809_2_plen_113_part_00